MYEKENKSKNIESQTRQKRQDSILLV